MKQFNNLASFPTFQKRFIIVGNKVKSFTQIFENVMVWTGTHRNWRMKAQGFHCTLQGI